MPNPLVEDLEIDTTAALADISSDLFGQGESSGDTVVAKGEGIVPAESSPAVEQSPLPNGAEKTAEETSTEVQAIGAPKTWTKGALEKWATLDPVIQAEVAKREEDFMRGISQYKQGAELGQRYNAVVEPFAPMLQAENIDPVQLFQSFAANHYLLSRGTPQQKIELAANLIQGYGVDLNSLITHIGEASFAPTDPRVQALEQELNTLKQGFQSRQQQEVEAQKAGLSSEIDAFVQNPANPYAAELLEDMAELFASGKANTLQQAYDQAIWMNPATRGKELERQKAEALSSTTSAGQVRQQQIARATAADVNLDPKSRNGTVPLGSIDDTLAETLARISARG